MSSAKTPRPMTRTARELALLQLGATLPILDRAYRATANQAMASLGLSQTMAWPLLMIGRQGDGLRQGALAELLGIEGPSLTRTLDQLVDAGLVERREDPDDRRAKTLYLTEAGNAACEQIEVILRDLRNQVYEGVPDADIEATLRVFAVVQQRLGCPAPIVPPKRK
ncbi:MarR family winged helix-turn-helix transcriptional regulator [Roseateles terrae]|uniref:MarR family transcriptional regulator for hemolysin n=1 Tax=Roseateles terrae TaxID=431060 RepID=A0ABR6GZ39_9BURK|nr:MarR family transcriptional regulator [Roseateles terrae]MBB3197334.1 MarR family transcriptional regulator for hemolysin [Roseateles terrae]